MATVVACGTCGRRFQVGRRKAGKTILCPHCGGQIFVPTADHQGDLDLGGDGGDDALSDMLGSPDRSPPATGAATPLGRDPLASPLSGPPAGGMNDFNLGGSLPSLGAGRLPPAAPPRLKRATAAPGWYANPLLWAGVVGAAIVLLVLVALFPRKKPHHATAETSDVASTGSLSGLTGPTSGTSAVAPSSTSRTGETAVPTGPPGQEVFVWNVVQDGVFGGDFPVVEKLAVTTSADRRIVPANHQGPYVIARDFSEPNRISMWNLMAGTEIMSWRGLPADPIAESFSQRGTLYAAIAMVDGFFQLIVVNTGSKTFEKAPLRWADGVGGPPVFMSVAGEKQIVIVPPGATSIDVWSSERTLVSRWPGAWPTRGRAYAVSLAGGYLAMMTPNERLVVLDLATGKIAGEVHAAGLRECVGMAYSLDGTQLAALFATGELAVWDMKNGRRLATNLVSAAPANSRTVPVQAIGVHGEWLVQGQVAIDNNGATRTLVSDKNKQPVLMVSGRYLLTFGTRNGIEYLVRERDPAAPTK